MYHKLVFLCLAVATIRSAPVTDVVPLEKQQPTVIPIVSQSEELESNGTYKFSYETGNGIQREETSYDKVIPTLKGRSAADSNEGGESSESNEIHVQQGSYSYTAPDGTLISVRYIADENGFRPTGDHIPQPIVAAAAAAAGGSSGEKSGRALKADNSADSPSTSKAAAPSLLKATVAATPPKPDEKKPEAAPGSASVELSEASTTEVAKSTESKVIDENTSEASPSTTEAGTTGSSAAIDASTADEATTLAAQATTKAAAETTKAAEETTKAADASTVAASEGSASTDASTTEVTSTTAAA